MCPPYRECSEFCSYGAAQLIAANDQVPLDHSKPEGKKAVIALVRKQSAYSDSELYRGPILFNPGGPGGSGVDLVLGPAGDLLSTIVGPEFDVVGFDPRGSSVRYSINENIYRLSSNRNSKVNSSNLVFRE